jgi:hypothetical protein
LEDKIIVLGRYPLPKSLQQNNSQDYNLSIVKLGRDIQNYNLAFAAATIFSMKILEVCTIFKKHFSFSILVLLS